MDHPAPHHHPSQADASSATKWLTNAHALTTAVSSGASSSGDGPPKNSPGSTGSGRFTPPTYRPPTGIPLADRKQTSLMVKALTSLKKISSRSKSGRKGLTSRQSVRIGKKKPKFY